MDLNQYKLSEAIKSNIIDTILNILGNIKLEGGSVNIVIDGATAIKLATLHGLYTLPNSPRRASDLDFFIYQPKTKYTYPQMALLARRLKQELNKVEGVTIEKNTETEAGGVHRFFLDKQMAPHELERIYYDWRIESTVKLPNNDFKKRLQVDVLADNIALLEPVMLLDAVGENTNRISVKNPLEAIGFKFARFMSGAPSSRQDIIDMYYLANGYNKNESKPLLNDYNCRAVRLCALIYLGVMDCVFNGELDLQMFDPTPQNISQLIIDLKDKLPLPNVELLPRAAHNLLVTAKTTMWKIFPGNKFTEMEIKCLDYFANPNIRDPKIIIDLLKEEYQSVFNRYPNLANNIKSHPAIETALATNQVSLAV